MSTTVSRLVEALRRRLPVRLLPLFVRLRVLVAWARPSVRADARAQMDLLLGRSNPEADLEVAARAYVEGQIWRGELRWHPETIVHQRVVGMEHLLAARDRGKGVILSFLHHGQYDGLCPSLARLGVVCHMMSYPYMLTGAAPRWLQQHVRVSRMSGGTVVGADIGTTGIVGLLRRGVVLAIASDVPGRSLVRFAGRELLGSSGAAVAAHAVKAPVVLVTSEVDEQGPFLRVHPPLEPTDFETPHDLLARMLEVHERVVVTWPARYDLPLARWRVPGEAGPEPVGTEQQPLQ